MRRIWYCVAMSLDGFIAGPNGEYDWIPAEPEIDWGAFMGRFDTAIMGRRSHEAALATAGGGALPGIRTYVFSRTLRPEDHPGVNIIGGDVQAALACLREAPGKTGKDIWLFGGGSLFRSLLELGEVDRIEVGLVPILLGGGIPFLPGLSQTIRLDLMQTRTYPSGITMLTYAVAKAALARVLPRTDRLRENRPVRV